jgi:hypothetical protein
MDVLRFRVRILASPGAFFKPDLHNIQVTLGIREQFPPSPDEQGRLTLVNVRFGNSHVD